MVGLSRSQVSKQFNVRSEQQESVDAGVHCKPSRWWQAGLICLLSIHSLLLAYSASMHSPTYDEIPTLVGGLRVWYSGQFDVYTVNPPLVKTLAATPIAFLGPKMNWTGAGSTAHRSEFQLGQAFAELHPKEVYRYITIARWCCIPMSLFTAWLCYCWGAQLYGSPGGLLAAALWCICPNVLGHGSLITPDVAASGAGLCASYTFWRWLQRPTFHYALIAGFALGIAEITKTTFLIYILLWPLMWIGHRLLGNAVDRPSVRASILMLVGMLMMTWFVINVSYGFERSFELLGNYSFESRVLSGYDIADSKIDAAGNRFRNTPLASIPVPFPARYIEGLDFQNRDFEARIFWSYLRGQWRQGGWWYYYLYAMGIKVPIATLTLVLLALAGFAASTMYRSKRIVDEVLLMIPAGVLILFVSSQLGFNHHLRYVLPVFPHAFILCGRLVANPHRWSVPVALVLILATTATWESLRHFPHSLSYYNTLVGGPENGSLHLLNSNTDWGQDFILLRQWQDQHPEAKPMGVAFLSLTGPEYAGVEYHPVPFDPKGERIDPQTPLSKIGPAPGWYAISVVELRSRTHDYDYFQTLEPVDRVGYSTNIYHISDEQARTMRAQLGLPPSASE